jgi:hypothetical protein
VRFTYQLKGGKVRHGKKESTHGHIQTGEGREDYIRDNKRVDKQMRFTYQLEGGTGQDIKARE